MKIFTKGFIVGVLASSHLAGFATAGAMAASFSLDHKDYGAEPTKIETVVQVKASELLAHADFAPVSVFADAGKKGVNTSRMAKPSSLLKGAVATRVMQVVGGTGFQAKERQMPTLSAYPNPTRGVTTLSLTQVGGDNYKIRISNTIGKIVQTIDLKDLDNATEIPLNLSHLPSGIYFYSLLINEKMVETKRLVLQR